MAKKRIKSDSCLNCGATFSTDVNYCPDCGQENDNKRQPISYVLLDLVQNFLSLDSKVANSIIPILFKPGFLTLEFIKGRRQTYIHPARLFLTLVVAYFLLSSLLSSSLPNGGKSPVTVTIDTTGKSQNLNFSVPNPAYNDEYLKNIEENVEPDTNSVFSSYGKIRDLLDGGVTDVEILLDSLGKERTLSNKFTYMWIMKIVNYNQAEFSKYLLDKLPWMIFLFMPVFALLLKLFFYKQDKFYIDHLIFSFHVHSFIFMLLIIATLVAWSTSVTLEALVTIIFIIYAVIALKKVYDQEWRTTIFKSILIFLSYSVCAIICSLLFLAVSFILY